jgi:hypothetical protein
MPRIIQGASIRERYGDDFSNVGLSKFDDGKLLLNVGGYGVTVNVHLRPDEAVKLRDELLQLYPLEEAAHATT